LHTHGADRLGHDPFEGHEVIVMLKIDRSSVGPIEDVENNTPGDNPCGARHGRSQMKAAPAIN
jgi:hypothetical protein